MTAHDKLERPHEDALSVPGDFLCLTPKGKNNPPNSNQTQCRCCNEAGQEEQGFSPLCLFLLAFFFPLAHYHLTNSR